MRWRRRRGRRGRTIELDEVTLSGITRMIRPRGRVLSGILAIGAILVVTVIVLFVLNRALTDTERVEELAGSVQSVVAIVAIVGGGAFAYYKLQFSGSSNPT